ncbi:MAG TPA: type I methionyl aminopeptidase [Spirochaetota bacterium]|nr:type I methionyl aminopeptidase [Spirochaetota bacterium]HPJ36900.1 type I methionyl aminopeptidase [Spirochaetota bacterium]HPQ51933.1 type I methionyl aminopeptidase [Spirochaetota bacterium]
MQRGNISLKSGDDIRRIKDSGKIIAEIFDILKKKNIEGLSTLELDSFVENYILKSKARPSFKTVVNYNHATCISINDEVVHGIPKKKKKIKDGDIVKVDIGVVKSGYFSDACITLEVGAVPENAKKLVETTRKSMFSGIQELYPGKKLGDIGAAIQAVAESAGYSVVRDFTGHGVGFAVHELPNVPHYGRRGSGMVLKEGMVLAVEPMLNEGKNHVLILDDGWTAVTADGKLSAQFEHTVAITADGPWILTE